MANVLDNNSKSLEEIFQERGYTVKVRRGGDEMKREKATVDIHTLKANIRELRRDRALLLLLVEAFPGFTDDATLGDPWIERMEETLQCVKANPRLEK